MSGTVHISVPAALMPPDTRHTCPVGPCRINLPGSMRMCGKDRARIPREIWRAISTAEKTGDDEALEQAWTEAVAAVERWRAGQA